jgi:hypothetical protein
LEQLLKILSVFALAIVELWAAIPAGLALELHPLLIGVIVSAGAIFGTFLVIFLGKRLRTWLVTRYSARATNNKPGLIHRIWHRYGIVGLGLLAPLLTGAPLGAALGVASGAPAGRLMAWMSLGIILWTSILTMLASLGWAGIKSLWH